MGTTQLRRNKIIKRRKEKHREAIVERETNKRTTALRGQKNTYNIGYITSL